MTWIRSLSHNSGLLYLLDLYLAFCKLLYKLEFGWGVEMYD